MNEYKYHDIYIGQIEKFFIKIRKEDEIKFREITGDINPMHCDDEYAKQISNGRYEKHITFGMLTASLLSTMSGVYLPGKYSLIHSIENISFVNSVKEGDVLKVIGEVEDKYDEVNLIKLKVKILNENNNLVLKSRMKILVQK